MTYKSKGKKAKKADATVVGDSLAVLLYARAERALSLSEARLIVVRGGTQRKRTEANSSDHDGAEGMAQDKQKNARAPAHNCEHGKHKARCQLFVPLDCV
jgi:hypothetical protein